jgi:predicted transport protein
VSDIKLFRIANGTAKEINGAASHLEKPLQSFIEANLDPLLGIRFLATEYSTGKTHAGRIDTLGLDEDDCPVIIEYKRSSGENIINQGLFYLDWLMDHQAEFKLLVLERFGKATADAIDWTSPRLICIAADFTKYDSHAVQQMDRYIELLRYRQFGKDLLLFELVNSVAADLPSGKKARVTKVGTDKTVGEWFAEMSPVLRTLFDTAEGFVKSLGDDVVRKDLKLYVAFKRLRNFATICFQKNNLLVYLRLDATKFKDEPGFLRDVRKIGHWGTGDVELTLKEPADLDRAKPLIQEAYDGGTNAS